MSTKTFLMLHLVRAQVYSVIEISFPKIFSFNSFLNISDNHYIAQFGIGLIHVSLLQSVLNIALKIKFLSSEENQEKQYFAASRLCISSAWFTNCAFTQKQKLNFKFRF